MYKTYLKQNNNNKRLKKKHKELNQSLEYCCTLQWEFLQTVFANVRRSELVCACLKSCPEADLPPSVPNGATAELSTRGVTARTLSVHTVFECLYMTICCLRRVFGRPREL